MKTPHLSKPDLGYVSSLAKAGWDGVVTAPKEPVSGPALQRALWAPLVLGAGLGVLGVCIGRKHRSRLQFVVGGLAGTILGLGAGVAWTTRGYTEAVARNVAHKVNDARDAHWLEKNPIAYA